MFIMILSIAVMAISIATAYMSRETWYSSVALLVLRNGVEVAAAELVEACGFSMAKARRHVAKAVMKHKLLC